MSDVEIAVLAVAIGWILPTLVVGLICGVFRR